MTQVPILSEGDLSSALNQFDVAANAINKSVLGGDTIIELGATPAGTQTNELRWSNVHQALMRWTGAQWIFAQGPPPYLNHDELIDTLGHCVITPLSSGTDAQNIDAPPKIGIHRASSIAVANTGVSYRLGGGVTIWGTAAGLRFRAGFVLSSIAAGVTIRAGFHDQTTGAGAVTDGAWFDIVAGVSSFKTSQASTVTTHGTTANLVAATSYTIHVWFPTGTTARGIIVKDDGTVVQDVTNVANVPTGAQRYAPQVVAICTAATALTLIDIDFIGAGYAP